MGSLSNLYISQSYTSLIHLGNDSTITTASVQLQDGLGNGIGVFVNSLGNVSLSGSFTSSLAKGYTWVGDGNNRTTLVATSSFGSGTSINTGSFATTGSNTFIGNQIIAGYLTLGDDVQRTADIYANALTNYNVAISTDLQLTGNLTASLQQGYVLVGDASGRTTTVATSSFGSTINTGSFATTGSNTFIGNQTIVGKATISGSSDDHLYIYRPGGQDVLRLGVSDNGQTFDIHLTGSANQQLWLIDNQGGTYLNTFFGGIQAEGKTTINAAFTASQGAQINGGNLRVNGNQSVTGSFGMSGSNFIITSDSLTFNPGTSFLINGNFTSTGAGRFSFANVDNSGSNGFYGFNNEVEGRIYQDFSSSVNNRINAITGSGGTIPAGTVSSSAQIVGYNIFATTGSNSFSGQQNVYNKLLVLGGGSNVLSIQNNPQGSGSAYSNAQIVVDTTTDPTNIYSSFQGVDSFNNGLFGIGINSYSSQEGAVPAFFMFGGAENVSGTPIMTANPTDNNIKFWKTNNIFSGNVIITGSLSVSGSPVVVSSQTSSFVTAISNNALTPLTLTYDNAGGSTNVTLDLPADIVSSSAQILNYGIFATTGSNTFVGNETFADATGNTVTFQSYSGSLVLTAKSIASGSSTLAHVTSSANQVNFIFKGSSATGETVISGSNNLFANQSAPTTGFRKYITNGNIGLAGTALPQFSSSMAFSPAVNSNYFANVNSPAITVRGPVSSSAWTINHNGIFGGNVSLGTAAGTPYEKAVNGTTLSNNIINGNLSVTAYKTSFISAAASAMTISSNNIGGGVILNADSSSISLAGNTIQNASLTVNNSYYNASATGGGGSFQLQQGNGLFGNTTLIYTSGSNTTAGTGRQFNANLLAGTFNSASLHLNGDNSQMVATAIIGHNLVVTGSSAIQTAAPIRSNTYGSAFFGRHNAQDGTKASTAETVFAVGTGTTTTSKTGFLIDSGSNAYFDGTLNVSGSTTITGSITIQSGSGDLYVHGHKQFNVGAFSSLVSQSGSANVSQSINFDTTDISQGVSIASNSRITIANAGTYNIQFSAQLLADAGADDVYIWLKKNGTNVSASAGKVTLANNEELIAAWNYVVDAAANDYYEIVWQSANGDAIILYENATGNIPSIPSIILTVTQVR